MEVEPWSSTVSFVDSTKRNRRQRDAFQAMAHAVAERAQLIEEHNLPLPPHALVRSLRRVADGLEWHIRHGTRPLGDQRVRTLLI